MAEMAINFLKFNRKSYCLWKENSHIPYWKKKHVIKNTRHHLLYEFILYSFSISWYKLYILKNMI